MSFMNSKEQCSMLRHYNGVRTKLPNVQLSSMQSPSVAPRSTISCTQSANTHRTYDLEALSIGTRICCEKSNGDFAREKTSFGFAHRSAFMHGQSKCSC